MTDPERSEGENEIGALDSPDGKSFYGDHKEGEIWSGTYSGKSMVGAWVLAGFLTILAAVGTVLLKSNVTAVKNDNYYTWLVVALLIVLIWGVPVCKLAYKKLSLSYTLTNKKVIHREGFLRRTEDEVILKDVTDISIIQTLFERMLGAGSIQIDSTDVSHPKLLIEGVADVKEVKMKFDEVYHMVRQHVKRIYTDPE